MRIILGITGSSGTIFGIRLIEEFRELGIDVSLVFTRVAKEVSLYETGIDLDKKARDLSVSVYDIDDLFAAPSSGSYLVDALVVLPCSMGSLSRFACGISNNLLERSFDVSLKERRRIIISPRETPLSSIHLENMLKLSREGVVIAPISVAFYSKPKSLDDIINFHISKLLNLLKIDHNLLGQWPNV